MPPLSRGSSKSGENCHDHPCRFRARVRSLSAGRDPARRASRRDRCDRRCAGGKRLHADRSATQFARSFAQHRDARKADRRSRSGRRGHCAGAGPGRFGAQRGRAADRLAQHQCRGDREDRRGRAGFAPRLFLGGRGHEHPFELGTGERAAGDLRRGQRDAAIPFAVRRENG